MRHERDRELIAELFVILDWIYHMTNWRWLLWVSPVTWIRISVMAYSREKGTPSPAFALVFLAVLDTLLLAVTCGIARRKDIREV